MGLNPCRAFLQRAKFRERRARAQGPNEEEPFCGACYSADVPLLMGEATMAATKKLTSGQKAAQTRKRRAAGRKAAATRKRRAAAAKAAATRKKKKA
jgi:hypothetical protein